MSSFNALNERLGPALACAKHIADLALSAINNRRREENYLEQIQTRKRDLPHLIKQAIASFTGDKLQADDLRHELECVQKDADSVTESVTSTWIELQKFYEDRNTNFGEAFNDANSTFQAKRRTLVDSCSRAENKARTICAAIDKAAKQSPSIPEWAAKLLNQFESDPRTISDADIERLLRLPIHQTHAVQWADSVGAELRIRAEAASKRSSVAVADEVAQITIQAERDPALRLLAAIDELVAFVRVNYWEVTNPRQELDETTWQKLADMEGRVVGLLAQVAAGRFSSLIQSNQAAHDSYKFTSGTGIRYFFSGQGREIDRDDVWEPKMRALRAAVQTVIESEKIGTSPAIENSARRVPAKKTVKKKRGNGGRPRSAEVEEVQKYIYERWIKGDKLAAIKNGAEQKFGVNRAPCRRSSRYASSQAVR